MRPNDLTMLEDMLKRNVLLGGTAGVIVEPVGPESGTRPLRTTITQACGRCATNTAR